MRGEFFCVWSETWREIWLPLIEQSRGENDDSMRQDIFCELYRELSKALRKPTGLAAIDLLVGDGITLREAFESAAQRCKQEMSHDLVKEAFDKSGAGEAATLEHRRVLLETALLGLLEQPSAPLLDAVLQEIARDATKVEAAWNRTVERTINDSQASREAFERTTAKDIAGERALVGFFEAVHGTLEEFENPGDDILTNRYFNLLASFIEKFSLRYDLRRPCILCPTLPGLFASLVRDLRAVTSGDPHLDSLMKEFENAVRDLRSDYSDTRIKTCIQKQVNLLEGLGQGCPGVTKDTLGSICEEIKTWPHNKVKEAMTNLYKFTCNYPGIRHAGTPSAALRPIELRDMVALSILLAGFTPYLCDALNAESMYRGT